MSEAPKQSIEDTSLIREEGSKLIAPSGDVYFYWDKEWGLNAVANDTGYSWYIVEDESGGLALELKKWNENTSPMYGRYLPPKHKR